MKGMNEKELNALMQAIRENERLKLENVQLKAKLNELNKQTKSHK